MPAMKMVGISRNTQLTEKVSAAWPRLPSSNRALGHDVTAYAVQLSLVMLWYTHSAGREVGKTQDIGRFDILALDRHFEQVIDDLHKTS